MGLTWSFRFSLTLFGQLCNYVVQTLKIKKESLEGTVSILFSREAGQRNREAGGFFHSARAFADRKDPPSPPQQSRATTWTQQDSWARGEREGGPLDRSRRFRVCPSCRLEWTRVPTSLTLSPRSTTTTSLIPCAAAGRASSTPPTSTPSPPLTSPSPSRRRRLLSPTTVEDGPTP